MSGSLRVAIQLAESGNLTCRHCATSASPKAPATLDRGHVRDVLQQAGRIDPDAEIVFTGEVFRVRDLLGHAVGLARELGLRYSVTTGGSWAVDPAERKDVLHSILDVRELEITADAYHGPHVSRPAIGLAVREALE